MSDQFQPEPPIVKIYEGEPSIPPDFHVELSEMGGKYATGGDEGRRPLTLVYGAGLITPEKMSR